MLKDVRLRLRMEADEASISELKGRINELNSLQDQYIQKQKVQSKELNYIRASAMDEEIKSLKTKAALVKADYEVQIAQIKATTKSKTDAENQIIALEKQRAKELKAIADQELDIIQKKKQIAQQERDNANAQKISANEIANIQAQASFKEQANLKTERDLINAKYNLERDLVMKNNTDKIASLSKIQAIEQRRASELADLNKKYSDQKVTVNGLSDTFQNLATTVGLAFSAQQVIEFGRQVINAKGLTDQFKNGMEALLQSKALANQLYAQVVELARASPLSVEDIMTQTLRMKGLGFETEKIIPIMTALGDVAAVVGTEKLGFLSKALSDVRNKQVLYAQELRQFSDNGVNLYQMLADSMNLPIAKVRELGENHKITYDMIEKALFDATAKGGMFYGQQAAQVNTVRGQLEKLKDTVFASMVTIGDYSEKGIMNLIKVSEKLIEVTIGSEGAIQRFSNLLGLGATAWATYNAAVLVANSSISANTILTTLNATAKTALGFVSQSLAMAFGLTTSATLSNTVATDASSAAMARGAMAARTFWSAMAGPAGIIVALGSAVAAHFAYNAITAKTTVSMSEEEKALRGLHSEFTNGVSSIKSLNAEKIKLEKTESQLKQSILLTNKGVASSTIASDELLKVQGRLTTVKGDLVSRFNHLKSAYPQYLKDVEDANGLVAKSATLLSIENAEFQKKLNLMMQESNTKGLIARRDELMVSQQKQLTELQTLYNKQWRESNGSVEVFVGKLREFGKGGFFTARNVLGDFDELNGQIRELDGQITKSRIETEKLNQAQQASITTVDQLTKLTEQGARTTAQIRKDELIQWRDAEIIKIQDSNKTVEEKKRLAEELGREYKRRDEAITESFKEANKKKVSTAKKANEEMGLDSKRWKDIEKYESMLLEEEKAKEAKKWNEWYNGFKIDATKTTNDKLAEQERQLVQEINSIIEPALKGEIELNSEKGNQIKANVDAKNKELQVVRALIQQEKEKIRLQELSIKVDKDTLETNERIRTLMLETQRIQIETSRIKNQAMADLVGRYTNPAIKGLMDLNTQTSLLNDLFVRQHDLKLDIIATDSRVISGQTALTNAITQFGQGSEQALKAQIQLNDAKEVQARTNKQLEQTEQDVTKAKVAQAQLIMQVAQMVVEAVRKIIVETIKLRNEAIDTMNKTFQAYADNVSKVLRDQITKDFETIRNTVYDTTEENIESINKFYDALQSRMERNNSIQMMADEFQAFTNQFKVNSEQMTKLINGVFSLNPIEQWKALLGSATQLFTQGINKQITDNQKLLMASQNRISQLEYEIDITTKLFDEQIRVIQKAQADATKEVEASFKTALDNSTKLVSFLQAEVSKYFSQAEIDALGLGFTIETDVTSSVRDAISRMTESVSILGKRFSDESSLIKNALFSDFDEISSKIDETVRGKVSAEFQGIYDELSDKQFTANRQLSQAQSDQLDILRDQLRSGQITQEQFREEELKILLHYRELQRQSDRQFETEKEGIRQRELERERQIQAEIKIVRDTALNDLKLFLSGQENNWNTSSQALLAILQKYNLDTTGEFATLFSTLNTNAESGYESLKTLYDKYYNTETGLIPLAEKDLRDFLLVELQKAADDQKRIEEEKANALLGIEENFGNRLAELTRKRNDEINRLNFELFEANRQAALAQLTIDLNQSLARLKAVNPFARGNDIRDFFNELRGQILGVANPFQGSLSSRGGGEFVPREGEGNTPRGGSRFFHGTEFVKGDSGIDKVPAMLNVGERVIKTALNSKIKGVSNQELVEGYLNYQNQMVMPNYEYLMTLPAINGSNDNSDVVNELKHLSNAMKELKQVNVLVENGRTSIQEKTANRIVTRQGQRLRG